MAASLLKAAATSASVLSVMRFPELSVFLRTLVSVDVRRGNTKPGHGVPNALLAGRQAIGILGSVNIDSFLSERGIFRGGFFPVEFWTNLLVATTRQERREESGVDNGVDSGRDVGTDVDRGRVDVVVDDADEIPARDVLTFEVLLL
mmetsp:Transcript_12994/g.27353  ORF Transcript_12994/g.27353 Transcript_12994/m.27353 type:complete len:147 (-) Transcript_12994:64-504(-)